MERNAEKDRPPMRSGRFTHDPITGEMEPSAQAEQCMPCGHSQRFVVSSDEGTSYCGECERIAGLEAKVEQLRETIENGIPVLEESADTIRRLADQVEELRAQLAQAQAEAEAYLSLLPEVAEGKATLDNIKGNLEDWKDCPSVARAHLEYVRLMEDVGRAAKEFLETSEMEGDGWIEKSTTAWRKVEEALQALEKGGGSE